MFFESLGFRFEFMKGLKSMPIRILKGARLHQRTTKTERLHKRLVQCSVRCRSRHLSTLIETITPCY